MPYTRILPIWKMWEENLSVLLQNRVSVLPYIVRTDDSTRVLLTRYQEASSLILQAEILNAQNRSFEALTAADSALRLMPGDVITETTRREAAERVVTLNLDRARTARRKGDQQTAEFAYLTVIAADSTNPDIVFEVADFYLQLGRDSQGLAYGKRAVEATPNDPATHTNLAVLYLNLNNHVAAEQELLQAVSLNRNFGRGWYFLAQLYQMNGRSEEAREAFRRVQELGYRE
jgi:tetratricopeptide (TPR) repeat protein